MNGRSLRFGGPGCRRPLALMFIGLRGACISNPTRRGDGAAALSPHPLYMSWAPPTIPAMAGQGRWGRVNRARARRPTTSGPNRTETRYAATLQRAVERGELIRFAFEAVRFSLASRTHYTPDFWVLTSDLRIELHEVKGSRGYALDPQGRVKLKVAAALYPELYFVGAVERSKKDGGGFAREDVSPGVQLWVHGQAADDDEPPAA